MKRPCASSSWLALPAQTVILFPLRLTLAAGRIKGPSILDSGLACYSSGLIRGCRKGEGLLGEWGLETNLSEGFGLAAPACKRKIHR